MSGEQAKPRKYKHVNTIRKTLADGTIKVYRYHRKALKPLKGAPGSKAFDESMRAALIKAPPEAKTFGGLIDLFMRAAEYTTKAEKTRADYDWYLDELRTRFGDLPLKAVQDVRVKEDFYAWRDERASSPRAADYAWSVLRRVLSVAEKRGRITINHARNPGTLYTVNRSDKILEPEEFMRVLAVSPAEFQDVLMGAVCTMLRQSDLCLLSWGHLKGDLIRFRTAKRKRTALIPVHKYTKAWLDSVRRRGTLVLLTKTGVPWQPDYVKDQWRDARALAGLADSDLHFHDLRGLGMTIASEAGCTSQMIAGATGLSLKQVDAVLDRYSARTSRLALAMRSLIENGGGPFLQTIADFSANRDK